MPRSWQVPDARKLPALHEVTVQAALDVLPVEAVVWLEGQAVQLTAELEAEV